MNENVFKKIIFEVTIFYSFFLKKKNKIKKNYVLNTVLYVF